MQTHAITLETSWPAIYHDLMAEGLRVTRRSVALRTQTKNVNRESEAVKFSPLHQFTRAGMRIATPGQQVLQTPSKTILEVMCDVTGTNYSEADFRLPVPNAWQDELFRIMGPLPARASQRPWLIYRPLVERPEWRGGSLRNADPVAYAALLNEVRDQFFVISVADLEEGREWLVGYQPEADMVFHRGELVFEALAALFARADLVFTSSGFPAVLGPAVGTPTISIIGGYEDYRCHDSGAKFAPYLAIGPKAGCSCWTSACRRVCDKSLDMDAAKASVLKFVAENCTQSRDNACPLS
jgi:hypothetical protein